MPADRADVAGLAAAFGAVVTWGLTGVFIRLLDGWPPLWIAAGRLAVALVVVVPALRLLGRRAAPASDARADGGAWMLGALMAAYYVCATGAFTRIPVADVALLIGAAPLLVLGYRLARGLPTRSRDRAGAALGFAGVATVVLPGLGAGAAVRGDAGVYALGAGLALLAAGASAAYAVGIRARAEAGRPPDTVRVTARAFGIGAAASLAFAFVSSGSGPPLALTPRDAAVFAALGAVSTAVPTVAFSVASRKLPAVLTTTFALLTPLFAGAFAALVLGERPSPWLVPGGALVLGGVFLTSTGAPLARVPPPPAIS